VALGELLGSDQLVLQFAAVPARKRVPAFAAVERPSVEVDAGGVGLSFQPLRQQLVPLHVDHHGAEPGLDVASEAPRQRVRLAAPRSAEQQAVAAGLASEAQAHRPAAGAIAEQELALPTHIAPADQAQAPALGQHIGRAHRLPHPAARVAAALPVTALQQERPPRRD
jgi:hypothetical protein